MTQTEEEKFQGAQSVILVIGKLRKDLEMPCNACHAESGDCPSAQCESDRQITICQAGRMFAYLHATLSFLSGREITFGEKTMFREMIEKQAEAL